MTDPSSGSWRRRRRGGRHQVPNRPASREPLPPEVAQRNRDAALGMSKRTWPGAASPPAGEESPASSSSAGHGRRAARPSTRADADPASAAAASAGTDDELHDAWSASAAGHEDPRQQRQEPPGARTWSADRADDDRADDDRADDDRAVEKRPLRRRSEHPGQGSLPLVAFWTVLTSFLPGSGLVTTRMRTVGWTLLGILVVGVVGIGGWVLLGDPLRGGVRLLTDRTVLIGLMAALVLAGVVWALQIVLANQAHSTAQRLVGAKRYVALAIAALMVVGMALPFGRGVHSLWATQGLLGSETVFGRDEGGAGSQFGQGEDPWAGVGRMNILLLGQDAGDDRTGTRPDTIMVASIDTETGSTALFSIPRNLEHVEFPEGTPAADVFPDGFDYFGGQQDLINAVWTWAEDRPDLFPNDSEPGLTATTWAVEETLGLETDYYAMVNLQGFEDMVDAIGGVEMVVERRIPIGGGASEVDGYIEPGQQHLDGYQALWYARSREGSNDFDRMCRQQRIVRTVTEEADPRTLAMSVPGLVSATEENIQTNIPVDRLDAFIDLALRIKDAGFTSYPITQDVTSSQDPDFEYLESWVDASIEDSMQQEEPESVIGETEDGSSDPAATGETPSGPEGADGASEPTAVETTEAETSEPTQAETGSPGSDEAAATESDPEIEQDPLQSCLPGAEQG